jgi:hypothetical protein
MDQTHKTQNTSDGTFSSLVKKEAEEVLSEPLKKDAKEIIKNYGSETVKKELSRGEKLSNFEAQVALSKQDGQEWLEVEKDVLMMICNGVYPKSMFITYKNVNVCEIGHSKQIIDRDSKSAYQKLFNN